MRFPGTRGPNILYICSTLKILKTQLKPYMNKTFLAILSIAVLSLCTLSCNKEEEGPVSVQEISLSQSSLELNVGEQAQLKATVKPDNATDKTVEWSSSDKSVATVSSSGNVTAVAAGSAVITASSGDKSSTCKVSVKDDNPGGGEEQQKYDYSSINRENLEVFDKAAVTAMIFHANNETTTDNVLCRNRGEAPVYYEITGTEVNVYAYADNFRFQYDDASNMFAGWTALKKLDIKDFDVSRCTSFQQLFWRCKALEDLNIEDWDVHSLTNTRDMFNECSSLKSLDLSKWETGVLEDVLYMFCGCKSLESLTLGNFNTSEITDFGSMFQFCESLKTLDLSGFDVKKTKGMSLMFHSCHSLTELNLSSFDPYLVEDVYGMFVNAGKTSGKCTIKCPAGFYYKIEGTLLPQLSLQELFDNIEWDIIDEYYTSNDFSKDGEVKVLQTATKGNGVNIVLMGDAYSDRLIAEGVYEERMKNSMEYLFSVEPYKSMRDYFNVYEVFAVSKTEILSKETVFNTQYTVGNSYTNGDYDTTLEYAKKAISDSELKEAAVVVIANKFNLAGTTFMFDPDVPTDYGSGMSFVFIQLQTDEDRYKNVFIHEVGGHAIGKLDDEYSVKGLMDIPYEIKEHRIKAQNEAGFYLNVDFTDDLSKIRWHQFISDSRYSSEKIGAYEGGVTYSKGVWRPTFNSIMNDETTSSDFNAPSRAIIYNRVNKLANGASWTFDYETFVEFDAPSLGKSFMANMKNVNSSKQRNYAPVKMHPPVFVER